MLQKQFAGIVVIQLNLLSTWSEVCDTMTSTFSLLQSTHAFSCTARHRLDSRGTRYVIHDSPRSSSKICFSFLSIQAMAV